MNIIFKNKRLAKEINSFDQLKKRHGQKMAELITKRLGQLQAMENLSLATKFPQLRCHELKGDRKGELTIDLIHPRRIVFTIAQNPYPAKEDGGLDWSQVRTIQIEQIEDYHGKRKKK